MNKIRVLHVFEPYFGGVPKYVELLLKYNNNSKIKNYVVCSTKYGIKKIRKYAAQIYQIDMEHQISPKSDIKVELTLRKIIKQLRPDIIYAHSSKAGAFARISDLGIRNKVIYNPHGWAFNMQQSQKKRKMYKWIERILAHFCDKIVCISAAEKESALKAKICKPSKLRVIFNGVDLKAIKETHSKYRKELNIPQNAFVVGIVGRLSRQKAPDIFVKAAYLIKKSIPNAFFLMVGDGELRDQIENLINKFGLDSSFLITGWVNDPIGYIKIMNVGTLLSRWEGFGLVLPEYMACGVPIVATKVDAIPNIIKNAKNGLLVKKDDYKEIAKTVEILFQDPHLKKTLIHNSIIDIHQNFNIRRVSSQTERLFINLLKRRKNICHSFQ